MGKGPKKRIDNLVTQAVDGGLLNTAENRRMARHTVKQKIKPDQALMDRFAHTFLIGKKIDVTIGQIVALARARPKKHQAETMPSKTSSSCRLDGAPLYSLLHTQHDPWRASSIAWAHQ